MDRTTELLLAAVAGVALGIVNYAGLHRTVRLLPAARRPGALLLGSFLLRTALVLGAILLAGRAEPARLAACLLGFAASRMTIRLAPAPTPLPRGEEDPGGAAP